MDVLNCEARICLVKSDRHTVRSRRKVNELLNVFSAWGRWRIGDESEYKVEDRSYIFREIGDVLIE